MTALQRLLLVAALAACATAGNTQDGGAAVPAMPPIKVVRGQPFSAEVTTESVQVLADGNRIVRKTTASVARDSEGRTRRQQNSITGDNGASVSAVFIHDPVAGAAYVLDPRSHVARKLAVTPFNSSGESVEVKTPLSAEGRPGDGRSASGAQLRTESLGTQLVDGLQADGTRVTRLIPAGQAGNERSIAVVTESWFSQDLQIVLLNKTTDPRVGETIYKVTDLKRLEPDRLLFEIPSGFAIQK
jgi:hypothetical protein